MSFKVSETQFPHLKNGNNKYTCLTDLVVMRSKLDEAHAVFSILDFILFGS